MTTGHHPNFLASKVVFREQNLTTRLKLESWTITKPDSNPLNLNSDDPIMSSWHTICKQAGGRV